MSAAILFSIVFCALIFGFVGLLENSDEYLLISYSFVAAVPTSIAAFVWQRKDPFSPMNFLNFIVIFSIPLYCVYINFVADHGKIERKLYGLEVVDLYPGITLVLIGVVFLIFGFFSIGSIAKRRTRYVMRSRSLFLTTL